METFSSYPLIYKVFHEICSISNGGLIERQSSASSISSSDPTVAVDVEDIQYT